MVFVHKYLCKCTGVRILIFLSIWGVLKAVWAGLTVLWSSLDKKDDMQLEVKIS